MYYNFEALIFFEFFLYFLIMIFMFKSCYSLCILY